MTEENMLFKWSDDRIQKAMDLAWRYSQIDGARHKAWVIDQMVQALCGSEDLYKQWVKEYTAPLSDNPGDYYEWDCGIAP